MSPYGAAESKSSSSFKFTRTKTHRSSLKGLLHLALAEEAEVASLSAPSFEVSTVREYEAGGGGGGGSVHPNYE